MPPPQSLLNLLECPATHSKTSRTTAGSEETFLSKAISDRLGLEVNSCNMLAVCSLSGESSVKVGQANIQVKVVDSLDDRTVTIENV